MYGYHRPAPGASVRPSPPEPPRPPQPPLAQLRLAAIHAWKVYPPGVAELVSRELLFFADMGLALPANAACCRAAAEILAIQAP